jgi:hypothetical protein
MGPRRMVHCIGMEHIHTHVNVIGTIDRFDDVSILVHSKIVCMDGTAWG